MRPWNHPTSLYTQTAVMFGLVGVANNKLARGFWHAGSERLHRTAESFNKTAAAFSKNTARQTVTNTSARPNQNRRLRLNSVKAERLNHKTDISPDGPYLRWRWWLLWTGLSNCWFLPAEPGWFSLSACPRCSAKGQEWAEVRQETPWWSSFSHFSHFFFF